MTIESAVFLLFLIMDPFGNVPIFLSVVRHVEPKRRRLIIFRELLIALLILSVFMFAGKHILAMLQVSESSLGVAGGVVLFLISLKMIFKGSTEIFPNDQKSEPLVVPLAMPLLAGPSAIAAVILIMAQAPDRWMDWGIALFVAWLLVGTILISAEKISHYVGNRALTAVERLMGILLTMVAVDMIIDGIKQSFAL